MLKVKQIWCTTTLLPLYVLHPYLETGAGDLFSIVWCSKLQRLYIGCQNTSLQWYDFSSRSDIDADVQACSRTCIDDENFSASSSLSRKAHKFFDSYPQFERRAADINASNASPPKVPPQDAGKKDTKAFLSVPSANVIDSAHYGYVYCMALLPASREGSEHVIATSDEEADRYRTRLITGSGDETVKVCLRNLCTIHDYSLTSNSCLALGLHPAWCFSLAYI